MPRERNPIRTERLTISVTPQIMDVLGDLLATGMYGRTIAEVAERVLSERLRELRKP